MNKWRWWGIGLAVLAVAAGLWWSRARMGTSEPNAVRTVNPYLGSIRLTVTTTGTVQPQNRLEVKPPIAGRVEQILVKEGNTVRRGQTLAWLSSTERAALLDAARAQGEESLAAWSEAYKPAPVISPITGTVIVRGVEPGQTVAASDVLLVLSDRLIVKAQVDETDIGKLKVGQAATLTLDAYPDIHTPARVDHIAYESKVVNNVTIYELDLLPLKVPTVFRSGMSANADIVLASKENVLLVPKEAIRQSNGRSQVFLATGPGQPPRPRIVELGLTDEKAAEVLSGVAAGDTLVIPSTDLNLLKSKRREEKTNPFMPPRPGRSSTRTTR